MSRATTRVEVPPPPGPDWKMWAEEMIDYLYRLNTNKQDQIDALEARIAALEP